MPQLPAGRGGINDRGRGGGRWDVVRKKVNNDIEERDHHARRPNYLLKKMRSFQLSKHSTPIPNGKNDIPEDVEDLHEHFRTCTSLTRIREELRNALSEDAERKMGFGLNACARKDENTGKLLLHSIGLNKYLISSGGEGTAAQSRVNQFVLRELLPAYPSAIVEEDALGRIPFTEPIMQWIHARRVVRKWKLDTDLTREKVSLVAAKLQRKMRAAASSSNLHHDSDSDSENTTELNKTRTSGRSFYRRGSSFFGKQDDKQARMELKMIVESSKDAMFCIDEKGKILLTNSASVRQFGYSKNELIGSNISIICNAHDASKHGEYLERYLRTGEKRAMGKNRELLAKKKDGSTFFIELGLTEVNCGGKFIFCGFVKDITNLKRHRKTLERTTSMIGTDNQEEGGDNARAHGIPSLVEWCLVILSEFVDNHGYGRLSGGGEDEDMESSRSLMDSSMASLKSSLTNIKYRNGASPVVEMMDTMVVEKVAAIPYLLEELLLVEDPEARSRIFDMSIVHKVLFNVDSLGNGNWLIKMLDKSIRVQKEKILDANLIGTDVDTAEGRAFQLQLKMAQEQCRFLAEGAVFYLEQVSELNIQDDLFVFHHIKMHQDVFEKGGGNDMISTGHVHHFEKHRNKLFDAVGELNGLVRRICVLEDDLVKRAASTPVIRRLLDKIMFSPFATLCALFDGIFHLLLMISFRLGPAPALFHLSNLDDAFHPQQYLFANATLMASVFYFGTKVIHEGLAKHALSENLFWSDATSFWNLLDIVPLVMVLICSFAIDIVLRKRAYYEVGDSAIPFSLRSLVAIITPFLWLRIMAFVKIRNKQLATFILCTVEIMKDIKWFLLVLFAAMASFAQMWVSLTFEPHHLERQYYLEGYLKAYTMMLGDLDVDALRTHPLVSLLFILYTFGVTIVLLNILIAIVSDSYQNSFSTSKMMLGKARVMFVSELSSLKSFHEMWMEGKTGTVRRNVNYLFATVAILHLWMITGTINAKLSRGAFCEIDTFFPNRIRLEAVLAFFFLSFILFAMKMTTAYVLNEFNDTGGLKSSISEGRSSSLLQRTLNWFIQNAFSSMSITFDTLFDREDERNELTSSSSANVNRTDNALQRSIEKSRKNIKVDLKSMLEQLQLSLREMEEQNKIDISNAITSAIAQSQQHIIEAMNQNQEDNILREEESESDHNSSDSSLSIGDVANLSQHM